MDRRRLNFAHLNEAVEDAHKLHDQGYERVGNWSLAENLEHLNKVMEMSLDAPTFRLPRVIRPILKWFAFGKMKRGEMIRIRANAPDAVQPGDDVDAEAVIANFERLSEIIESDGIVLSEEHPVFGDFTVDEWRIMHRWHASHHLSFLIPQS